MKYFFFLFWLSTFTFSTYAQSDQYQPSIEDRKLMFQDDYYLKDWEKVEINLELILANDPMAGEKYYIKGVKAYDKLLKSTADTSRISNYQTKSLALINHRIEYYGTSTSVENQLLSKTYRFWIKQPAKYDSLRNLFEQHIDQNVDNVSPSNLMAYFDVLRRFKRYNEIGNYDKILNDYDKISHSIATRGDDKSYIDKIDQMLFKIVELDCDKINQIFEKEITELNKAKQYLNMIFRMNCKVNNKAIRALDIVLKDDPSYSLCMYAAKKSIIDSRLNDSEQYLGMALGLANTSSQTSEIYLQLAKTMTLKQNKIEAYRYAKRSLINEKNPAAYRLIGNLYLSSFNECIGEKDIVARRAVFIAAYDQFKLANDKENMILASAQFPTMEEIHFNSYELGQKMLVDCWFKEEIVLAKRTTE